MPTTRDKLLIYLTAGELEDFIRDTIQKYMPAPEPKHEIAKGIKGLAKGLRIGTTKAQEIKNSGIIDKAITHVGKVYYTDITLARELMHKHRAREIH